MRLVLSDIRREIDAAVREMQRPMAVAATAAVKEAGEIAVAEGRSQIASLAFGREWQQGFISNPYPKGGKVSLRALTIVRHTNPLAGVHEEGATIAGQPLLWLPLDNVPRVGNRQLKPKEFSARFGKLRSVPRAGKRPLLVGRVGERDVPLYVGIDTVRIRKRFTLYNVIARAAARLPELYVKHFKGF